jgi:selenide, water dikinase
MGPVSDLQKAILADPQTSGGLLIAVQPAHVAEVQHIFANNGLQKFIQPIGRLTEAGENLITVSGH